MSHYETTIRPLIRTATSFVSEALAAPASDAKRMSDADAAIRRAVEAGATVADLVSAIGPNDWRVFADRMKRARKRAARTA